MKRQPAKAEPIYKAADRVTRASSESEDMDLAAEATEGAPAKRLAAERPRASKALPRRKRR